MSIQTIQIGTYPNDGTGDDLRTAFQKVNANFQELNVEINVGSAENLGSGVGLFKNKNGTTLGFKSLTSTNNSITITPNPTTVDLVAAFQLQSDLNPRLGGNLNLQNFHVEGGDIQTTIFGIDVTMLNALLSIALQTNSLNLDLGTIPDPTGNNAIPGGYTLDFKFILNYPANTYDFGSI
jgi:hypothetical protein